MKKQREESEILLSPGGLRKLKDELERLKTVDRKRVAERIRDAKGFGEFFENSEYEEAKNEQAYIEGRIEELTAILRHASVIDEEGIPVDHVGIGSVVRVRDLSAMEEWECRVVGSFESDPSEDCISNESPIGAALMGCKVGDVVEVRVPAGTLRLEIIDIHR
ncbi:MAG: transcription elongation factor GreA [Armatimonadota bacterium]|jgi:transcription elongation factor GreA